MMNNAELTSMIDAAADYLRERGAKAPEIGIILGSGLGSYTERLENAVAVSYTDIPWFPVSTAPGHKGTLYIGHIFGREVLVMSGRFHYYEGYEMSRIVFPIRVMAALGIRRLILTNAAGCINMDFGANHLMLLSDHSNCSGTNPLIGPNPDSIGTRFPDMSEVYSKALREKIKAQAAAEGIDLCEGVYAMYTGPSFETPAEIRFLHIIGADAVGMSTVPEAIAARHAGIEVAAISCLANMAAGLQREPLSGDDVIVAANALAEAFTKTVDIAVQA